MSSKEDEEEKVNHPKHYNAYGIECIDFIEASEVNSDFRLSSAIKYIFRCLHKGRTKEDLDKAIWYLERYLLDKPDSENYDLENNASEFPAMLGDAIYLIVKGFDSYPEESEKKIKEAIFKLNRYKETIKDE